jgi:hypothetical protein
VGVGAEAKKPQVYRDFRAETPSFRAGRKLSWFGLVALTRTAAIL